VKSRRMRYISLHGRIASWYRASVKEGCQIIDACTNCVVPSKRKSATELSDMSLSLNTSRYPSSVVRVPPQRARTKGQSYGFHACRCLIPTYNRLGSGVNPLGSFVYPDKNKSKLLRARQICFGGSLKRVDNAIPTTAVASSKPLRAFPLTANPRASWPC
jgi:hypothetical protein